MPSRVVRPETKTLSISGGDWVLVKKRLNHGEQQASFARRYLADAGGHRVNLQLVGMEKVTAYLLDWSLTDLEEHPLVIKSQPIETVEAALNAIDPESFVEIRDAIEAHEVAMALARAAEKNDPGGEKESPAISPSPDAAAGATSGSPN